MRKRSSSISVLVLLLAAAAAYYLLRPRPAPEEPVPGPVSGNLVVHFLDIGQGDCELLRLPGGETILIDSGDAGAPTVDILKRYGVREIDLAIATHPHQDHIGEMRDIMRAINVKEVWDSGFPLPRKTYELMLQEIKDRGIKFSTPRRGLTRRFGDVLVEVVAPDDDFVGDNPNNGSIVVRVTFGSKRFLFTGDSELEAWAEMMRTGGDKLRADVLKAAHHGSSNGTTADVLDAVRPSVVTISCKLGNDYHHPHPRVVGLLEQQRGSIRVFRTDLQGDITAVCDGNSIEMRADRQVPPDQLYLTGDEAAGKVAGRENGARGSSPARGGRGSR
ncbi:MAG TPA: MBL fold metallo-hydrolase [Blastocatellia bacterium]|nr:MBL fold metallo-hydrolase [Blastocatellia bacterium]